MHFPVTAASNSQAARLATAVGLLNAGDIDAAEQAAQMLCDDYPHAAGGFALYARCADVRGNREASLARWLDCEERFPSDSAKWRIGLGYAYLGAQRLAEAARVFNAALDADANSQPALAGQAMVVSRTAPAEAEALWRELSDLVGGALKPNWHVNRARALAACGNEAQAIAVLDQALADTPGYKPAMAMRANLLGAVAARSVGADTKRLVDTLEGAPEHLERAQQQRRSGDLTGARASLHAAMQVARTAGAFTRVLNALPSVFQTYDRTQAWLTLRARATGVLSPDAPETICLQMRLDIALRDFDTFLRRWGASPPQPHPWGWRFARLAATLQSAAFPDLRAAKVFGVGLSKTGTSSLGLALEHLGYLQAHFQNPFSNALLSEVDFALFDAASDTPVSARFETLYALFPNAKFILTERPIDSWVKSFHHHFRLWQGSEVAPFRSESFQDLKNVRWGLELRMVNGGIYPAHAGPATAYDAHIKRVERFFADKPAGKLLRHNVFRGDGWAELCLFLGHDVPEAPYPWTNQAPISD